MINHHIKIPVILLHCCEEIKFQCCLFPLKWFWLRNVYLVIVWQHFQEFLWTDSFTGHNNMMAFISVLESNGLH